MASVEEHILRIERLIADFEQHMLILQQKTISIMEEIVSIKGEIAVLPTIINVVDVAADVASTDAEASADAEAESSEVIKVLDTLGPDYMQCYLPGDIRDVCATGKTIALAFSCDMRVRVTTPNDAPEEGTIRRIRNAGINELQIVLCELDIELTVLQPNEIATLVFRDGAWAAV